MVAPLWNVGSVVQEVGNRVVNIPTSLSGTNMNNSVYGAINNIKNWTGQDPGDTDIDVKFHEALVCLVASKITQAKIIQSDVDGESNSSGKGYKIGDFSFSGDNYDTGKGSSLELAKEGYDKCADAELRALGYKMFIRKARG